MSVRLHYILPLGVEGGEALREMTGDRGTGES